MISSNCYYLLANNNSRLFLSVASFLNKTVIKQIFYLGALRQYRLAWRLTSEWRKHNNSNKEEGSLSDPS